MNKMTGMILAAMFLGGCAGQVGDAEQDDAGADSGATCCYCEGPVAVLPGGHIECQGETVCPPCIELTEASKSP